MVIALPGIVVRTEQLFVSEGVEVQASVGMATWRVYYIYIRQEQNDTVVKLRIRQW